MRFSCSIHHSKPGRSVNKTIHIEKALVPFVISISNAEPNPTKKKERFRPLRNPIKNTT